LSRGQEKETTQKKFLKNFQKTLVKYAPLWYNKDVPREEQKTKREVFIMLYRNDVVRRMEANEKKRVTALREACEVYVAEVIEPAILAKADANEHEVVVSVLGEHIEGRVILDIIKGRNFTDSNLTFDEKSIIVRW
jgi:hypothetical protein